MILLLSCTHTSAASDTQTLNYGYFVFPPYHYKIGDRLTGHYYEYVKKLAAAAGFRLNPIPLPRKRIYTLIDEGVIELWTGAKIDDLIRHKVIFSKKPIDQINIYLYSTTPIPKDLELRKVTNQSIVLILGYRYNDLAKPLENPRQTNIIHHVKSHKQGVHLLSGRHLNYFVGYEGPAEDEFRKSTSQPIYRLLLGSQDIYLKINKKLKDHQRIMDRFEVQISQYPFQFSAPISPLH